MNLHATSRLPITLALSAFLLASTAHAQITAGVQVNIATPGVYGQINIGNLPPPAVVVPQPVLIAPPPMVTGQPVVVAPPPPIYLYVPPGHQKNWRHCCARYHACDRPVLFVRDDWVRDQYAHAHPDRGHDHDHGHDHDDDHRDHGDHDGDRDHGHGDDRGRGDDHGHRGGDN